MSKHNDPNVPIDPTEQKFESVSLPQISIHSESDSPSPSLTSPPSPSSSLHASSLSYSGDSPSSPPSPSLFPPSLSLTSLEIESKSNSESASHASTNVSNKPTPPAMPSTEPPPSSPTPHQPALSLSLTIPLLAFTSHKSPTPLLNCGSITFSPEELVDASYDFLVAKVMISIEKILLSQRDEAPKHAEWMEGIGDGGEGSMGDGIIGTEFDDIGDFHGGIGGDTLPHAPLGNRGSGVGDVGLGSALRHEGISNLRCGVLEMFGQSKSKELRDKKDRKRRWEFQIYEDPVDREPGRPEAATISRPSRERLANEREQIDGGQRVREHVGEDQENEETGGSRQIQTRPNENVGEIANDAQSGKLHPTNSSLPPPTQSRTPLATLSYLPKPKECNPTTLYIHWTPEPLIPAEYIERTTRMCPTVHVSSSRISQFHPSTSGDEDGDGRNIVKEVDDIHTEGESKEKEEEEEAAKNPPIPTLSTTPTPNNPDAIKPFSTTSTSTTPAESEKLNLTILHASFPTHAQFTDAYGNGDGEEMNSEGIRELLRFVRERGGRDELIVEYVLL